MGHKSSGFTVTHHPSLSTFPLSHSLSLSPPLPPVHTSAMWPQLISTVQSVSCGWGVYMEEDVEQQSQSPAREGNSTQFSHQRVQKQGSRKAAKQELSNGPTAASKRFLKVIWGHQKAVEDDVLRCLCHRVAVRSAHDAVQHPSAISASVDWAPRLLPAAARARFLLCLVVRARCFCAQRASLQARRRRR